MTDSLFSFERDQINDCKRDFEFNYPVFVVTGGDQKELRQAKAAIKQQLAFNGSAPTYKPVFDSIGAGELLLELKAMSKKARWTEMGNPVLGRHHEQFRHRRRTPRHRLPTAVCPRKIEPESSSCLRPERKSAHT